MTEAIPAHDDLWTIPLFGVEVAGQAAPSAPDLILAEFFPEYAETPKPTLQPDVDDIPSVDFQPRLSRFGEAA